MIRIAAAGIGAALACTAIPAGAHHSFAVFFDPQKPVTLEGTVKAFRFTNPHGTIVLDVDGDEWRVETTAPVVLRRRGWSRSSIRPGERVTIEGWGSRDGKRYVRLRAARDADGHAIGDAPFTTDED